MDRPAAMSGGQSTPHVWKVRSTPAWGASAGPIFRCRAGVGDSGSARVRYGRFNRRPRRVADGSEQVSQTLTNILTESGTNEVEVLVFHLNEGAYGVNVAKVREILPTGRLTRLPRSHRAVRGVFRLRENVLPLVDLRAYFNMPSLPDESSMRIIVTEFNGQRMGFLVDHVERIYRMSWKDMSEAPWTNPAGEQPITSIAHVADAMVLMLDFERIAFQIAGIDKFEAAADGAAKIDRARVTVLLADDSSMMRRMLERSLRDAHFGNVIVVDDGQQALEKLIELADGASLPDMVVTDIEMPRMDGLCLTKCIRENPRLAQLPVIVFSSLVSDDNLKKGEAVGANRQLTKPQLPRLVETIDEVLSELVPA
jgi:two-component system chemotaxis response regulator CheV